MSSPPYRHPVGTHGPAGYPRATQQLVTAQRPGPTGYRDRGRFVDGFGSYLAIRRTDQLPLDRALILREPAAVQLDPCGPVRRVTKEGRPISAWLTPADGEADRDRIAHLLNAAGGEPRWWSNEPGAVYAPHEHNYHKVLFCVSGSIVFVVDDEQLFLTPGDRLDIEPATPHAAVVGTDGVTCGEVAVPT